MTDRIAGMGFAVVALGMLGSSVLAEIEAAQNRNILLGVFSSILMVFCFIFGYEAAALLTGKIPTLSRATDLAYVGNPVLWLSIYVVLMMAVGALSIHFTRTANSWHWGTALLGMMAFGIGCLITVLTNWVP